MLHKGREKKDNRLRILVIGSLPPPLGGTSVALKHLIDALAEREDVEIFIVNTSIGGRGSLIKDLCRFVMAVCRVIGLIGRVDVVALHVVCSKLHMIGTVIYALARLWRRPFMIRLFGGIHYLDCNQPRRSIARWLVRRCNLFLVETRALVRAAQQDKVSHVVWYPNSRPLYRNPPRRSEKSESCRRFVYLGHVRPAKGISELIEAAERFGPDVSVDVYGPFLDGLSEECFAGLQRVSYRGVVDSDKVIDVLTRYDAFVMPTHHAGEGYPGVIFEAYGAGLPVICTQWQALPEIVDEDSGILIEPYDSDELYNAMKVLSQDNQLWARLRQGALAKRKLFDADALAEKFVECCRVLAEGRDFKDRNAD